MYIPSHFAETDTRTLHAWMRSQPLATLITHSENGLDANHIPLHLTAEPGSLGILRGHVARANPLWSHLAAGTEALAVFMGPQAYITPSWYPTKAETGKAVPTWNYVAVHAYGTLRAVDNAAWLRSQLEALTAQSEAAFAKPWHIADAPPDYIARMLTAIMGVEMVISRLEGKRKTSQNQPACNRAGVEAGLRELGTSGTVAMAALVAGDSGTSTS